LFFMNKQWQTDRERLNHDILCNQLRTELLRLCRNPHSEAVVRLASWPSHKDEYLALFDHAAEALSPRYLMELDLFNCWTREQKQYFGEKFHELFLITSNIETKTTHLKSLLSDCIDTLHRFLAVPSEQRTVQMVKEIQQKLDYFSEKISELPTPSCGI